MVQDPKRLTDLKVQTTRPSHDMSMDLRDLGPPVLSRGAQRGWTAESLRIAERGGPADSGLFSNLDRPPEWFYRVMV